MSATSPPNDISSGVEPSDTAGMHSSGHIQDSSACSAEVHAKEQMRRPESGMDQNSAWAKQNVLTFDGGGIRGYYSLLHLEKLMEYIETEERKTKEKEDTSFAPCGEPRDVSHRPKYRHYLPCHYFDYIGGTSTGALITIMLACLRMPVEDCLYEYQQLAGLVFGNPRLVHQASKGGVFTRRNKFSTSCLELAIKDVIRRRGEKLINHDDAILFRTPKGLCRAIVFANRNMTQRENNVTGATLDIPWAFRSYDHYYRDGRRRESSINATKPRNPGQGTNFAAWKVARAATAAPLFFKPLEIALDDGQIVRHRSTGLIRSATSALTPRSSIVSSPSGAAGARTSRLQSQRATALLTDAGFGRANNPSEEVLKELWHILREQYKKIGTWVSIGTARAITPLEQPSLEKAINRSLEGYGDPEPVHENMIRESKNNGFSYYRFNEANGLKVAMDEWKPRGSGESSGTETIEAIKTSFAHWASKGENVALFQKCAKELVANRKQRAKESVSRWERYALGSFFVCNRKDCLYDLDEVWHYQSTFKQHLRADHNIHDDPELDDMIEQCRWQWEYKSQPSRS